MIKEIKYLIYSIIIFLFIFFICKYYFSDSYKKKSFRSLSSIENKIQAYSKKLPVLEDDTKNFIEYIKNTETQKRKNYFFWELIEKK